jgi:hypothetical protein
MGVLVWEYESFQAKAQLYFTRAREHPAAEDDVLALWLLLGMEFLLRAPLAKVHPALLAEPNGSAIMHACGVPLKPDGTQPKSVQTKTVILRLGSVVPGFDKDREEDASFLAGLRNEELHSSEAALVLDIDKWLPHFTRVVEVICTHLKIDPESLVGREIMEQGRALVDIADKKLEHEVRERIAKAKEFFSRLRPEEVEARRAALQATIGRRVVRRSRTVRRVVESRSQIPKAPTQIVVCPACEQRVPMLLGAVRSTNQRLEDDSIVRDVIYIGRSVSCVVCDLELRSTAEIRAAGIPQQYVREERESLEDRFASMWDEGEDYGND